MGIVLTAKSRFRLGLSPVTLAVAGALATSAAHAGDAVISSAQTTPAATSRADGSTPGHLTLAPEGSIRVSSGPAVTIDSSNTFTNNGTIEVTNEAGAKGVMISTSEANGAPRDIVGGLFDNGTINLPGPAQSGALWPEYVYNTGIEVSGSGTFIGSIVRGAGSTMTVGGNGSTGIAILTGMDGSLENSGTIKLGRQDAFGVKATGAISGNIVNNGTIEATGQEGVGIYAGGGVDGAIINRGSIITGAPATKDSAGTDVPAVRGGRALWVAGNAGGIFLEGNGLTKEQEDASGIPDGAPADSVLSTRGTSEALGIGPGGPAGNRNITIGALAGNAHGASVVSRGNIIAEAGVTSTTPVRAVNITGALVGNTIYRTTLEGGFRNEGGNISSFSKDSVAQGIRIGNYASVPSLFNSGTIHAKGVDSGENADTGAIGAGGGNAYGIVIEANGYLAEIVNTGTIHGDSRGGTQSGYGIVDLSGTLTTLVNDGRIIASRRGTGSATAFDLTKALSGVSVSNSGSIAGNMLFGAGDDVFTSTGGLLLGNVSMGAGDDVVSLTDTTLTGNLDLGDGTHAVTLINSTLEGGLTHGTNGATSLEMVGSTLKIPTTSEIKILNGHIRGGSTLNFNIDATNETVGGIRAAGNLIVENGTIFNTSITGAVVDQFTVNLIEASALQIDADLGGLQPGSTVMYSRAIRLADDNPNILQYQITRRTSEELELSPILGSIYDASIGGLGGDSEFAGVMANFTDQAKFEAALAEMVPDTSDAARRIALNGRGMSQGAIQRRLSGFPSNRNDPLGRFRSGFWLQNVTTFGGADGEGAVPGYSTFSMGVAGGVDAEVGDQSILGFSLSQTFGSAEEDNRATEKVKLSTTSIDFYGRTNMDFGYVQALLGYSFNSYSQDRTVAFESIERATGGSSPGYQWGGVFDAGSHYVTGGTTLTGFFRGAYQNIYRHAFEESGGGPAVDLRYDSRSYTSVRAGAGGSVEHRISMGTSTNLAINVHGEYAHEFNHTPTRVRARFAASDVPFEIEGMTPAKNILNGGAGIAWERRMSTLSLDYDAQKAGSYLGHTLALTYRQRF